MSQKQIKCDRGHYYASSLGVCPICRDQGDSNTVLLDIGGAKAPLKRVIPQKREEPQVIKKTEEVKKISSQTQYISSSADSSSSESSGDGDVVDEVVLAGWLVITSDKGKGKSYPITFGFNSIGRGENNHIIIRNEDNSISREKHAIIIYDYSNNLYFLKHEDGKFLTYLNGELVLETKKLTSFDIIKVGNTELLFVGLCGDKFKWEA